MAEIIETIASGAEVTAAVLKELNINEFNSIRIWDGNREVVLYDLRVVIYQDVEQTAEMLADLLNDNLEIVFDTTKCIAHIQTSSSEFDVSFYPLGTKWDEDFEFDTELIDGGIVQDGDALDAVNYAFDFIPSNDDQATLPLSDEENKEILSNAYRTKDKLAFNIASSEENTEEFRIHGNELLTAMHNTITKDIVKMAIECEYNENEGILGQITDNALCVVRKYFEDEYDFPKDEPVNLGLCDAVYEFVRFQGIKHFNVDIAEKQDKPLLITIKADIEHNDETLLLETKYCLINSFKELEATMEQYVEETTKEKFSSLKAEASPDLSSSIVYCYGDGEISLFVTMEHDSKKIVFPDYYPAVIKPYVLQNSGDINFYVQEYKAGEFGIYDEENNELYADCFESVEQAQEWYDAEVEQNKKLKDLNDAIFEDVENAIIPIEKNNNDDEVPCIYCKENPSNHFLCESCGAGMCDECYDSDREHTQHCNKPLEECEDIHIDAIKKVCNSEDPDYICETCMEKALSLKSQDFADEANSTLSKTSFRAVIIETSELYGEDDDELDEGDEFYLASMYEGHIEDDWDNEIDNTRTGRYCSLLSVTVELEEFARLKVINLVSESAEKLVGTRWESKEALEKHLINEGLIAKNLDDADESGLVQDYSFVGNIIEESGILDIYYLKIPYGNESIYITEVNVTNE